MTLTLFWRVIFCGILLVAGKYAYAADPCSTTSGSASFSNNSSFTYATNELSITASSGLSCGGSTLVVAGTSSFTATVSSAHYSGTPQLFNSTTNSYLPYKLCQDTSCGVIYNTANPAFTWTVTSLLDLLKLLTATNNTLPLYLKTIPGINIPAGIYTDTLTINWNYTLCDVAVVVCLSYITGSATSTITVTATVTNDCYIDNAPDVNFGSAPLPAQFQKINSALSVRCTKNATYKVNMTSQNPVNGDWRQMLDSTGNHALQYQLYHDDNTAWTSTSDVSQMGNGISQPINYSAKINPSQDNQPAGTYTDKVLVTVTY